MIKFNKNKDNKEVYETNFDVIQDMYVKLIGEEKKELEKKLNKEKANKLNILGTLYHLETVDDESLEYGGLVDFKNKIITINTNSSFQVKELYHEIIHAFLFESGLHSNSEWAENEEMIDWFALQFDKIIDVARKGTCCLMEK